MELETTLSQTIRTAGSNSDYDSACKRLLSEKIILAWIMKNCLEEYRECSISEIIEKYIEGEPQVAEVPVLPDQTNPSLIKENAQKIKPLRRERLPTIFVSQQLHQSPVSSSV